MEGAGINFRFRISKRNRVFAKKENNPIGFLFYFNFTKLL